MREPDQFDEFYRDVRTRLLLLTYCLTGDLPSSRAAVRDAFVVAWHHWRKVSRIEDPEAWVRERACRTAQRRHTAKLWHREKGLDPEVKATLAALGQLSFTQRRVLLITELTTASLAEMAREVGVTRTEAERELQIAASQFSVHREVPTTSVRTVLESVRGHLEDLRWPRSTIIRRSGATRRRTHTVIGVAAATAALVVTGTLVSDTSGVRPTLAGERIEASDGPDAPEPVDLPEDAMLTAEQVTRAVPGHAWSVLSTDDGSTGDEVVMPCQESRYASPRPVAALTRVFEAGSSPSGKATTRSTARATTTTVQATEASATEKAARRGYDTAVSWFAGCADDRAQLMSTQTVGGVGDEATLVVLRAWAGGRDSTIVAEVARTGRFTTLAVSRAKHDDLSASRSATLLGDAVSGLCDLDGAGACTTVPRTTKTAPVPVGDPPGMIDVVDLPPVSGVTQPWVAAPAKRAVTNPAASLCDNTSFTDAYAGSKPSRATTASFLVLKAQLPDEFGLTETQGSLPTKAAKAFVAGVRAKLDRCEDKVLGTSVRRTTVVQTGRRDLTVWHITSEVSDKKKMTISMAILRDGTSVAQLGFVPAGDATMADGMFEALAGRAMERLQELPAPAR